MVAREMKFSGEPVGDALDPLRDAGLGGIGSPFDVGEEGCRMRPHRQKFAPRVAAGPEAEVRRQALRRVLLAERSFAGSRESFGRFRRAKAARRNERVAESYLQLSPPLALSLVGLDLVRPRQRSEQRLSLRDLR